MRHLALALLCLGCASTPAGAPAPSPELSRPSGGLLVALTSASSDPQPQADAFARFVEESLGQPVRGVVFPDYDALAAALAKGQVDIAFLSPLAFVRATDSGAKVQPVLRAVRNGRDTYHSVLFARADRAWATLKALERARNLRAAWVDASSATGYLFPKAMLVLHGIDPAGLFSGQEFLGSHDAVCRAVAEGRADLGATFVNAPGSQWVDGCRRALGEAVSQLQVVAQTEEIPNDVLAVRPDFPEEAKGRLLVGATLLPGSEEGKQTLQQAFAAEGFSQIKRDDYEVVRRAVQVFRP